jgi:hypothetical protein
MADYCNGSSAVLRHVKFFMELDHNITTHLVPSFVCARMHACMHVAQACLQNDKRNKTREI